MARHINFSSLSFLVLSLLLVPPVFAEPPMVGSFDPGKGWIVEAYRPQEPAPSPESTKQISGETLSFSLNYQDVNRNTNFGFDDPSHGPARRAVFEAVLMRIDSLVQNSGTVDIEVKQSQDVGSGLVASAGPLVLLQNGFTGGAVFERLVNNGGNDTLPGFPDMNIQVDFGHDWYSGFEEVPDGNLDLYSVLLHEMLHGLGMVSLSNENGQSVFQGQANMLSLYDDLLETASGEPIWSGNTPSLQVDAQVLSGGLNSVYFAGTESTTSLGSRPALHTPPSFSSGSSLGHWQEDTRQFGRFAVMNPVFLRGAVFRELLPFEKAVLADLGYTVDLAEPPSSDPSVVLAQLNSFHWESRSPAFNSPEFNEVGGLGLAVVENSGVTFGFWETREALDPLAAGTHRLTFQFNAPPPGAGLRQPEIRVRVFSEDNSFTDMAVMAQAGDQFLRDQVVVYTESDGSTRWKIAVDLLSTTDDTEGGVTLTAITREAVDVQPVAEKRHDHVRGEKVYCCGAPE